MAELGLTRAFRRPGVFFIYGRPLSFKTAFSLWIASKVRGEKIYAAAGKHVLVDAPSGFDKVSLYRLRDAVKFSLTVMGDAPEALVLDGVEALLAPLRGVSRSRVQLQFLLLLFSPLVQASRQGCRCYVTVEGGEKPHFYSVLRRLATFFARTYVEEEEVRVELRDKDLRVLKRYLVSADVLSGVYGDSG